MSITPTRLTNTHTENINSIFNERLHIFITILAIKNTVHKASCYGSVTLSIPV